MSVTVPTVELALGLHGDGVEDDGRLPGAGHADEHGDPVLRDLQRDVLEVVLSGSDDPDAVQPAHKLPFGAGASGRVVGAGGPGSTFSRRRGRFTGRRLGRFTGRRLASPG